MAQNKDLTCRICGAQFDSRDSLDRHTHREHKSESQSGYGDARSGSEADRADQRRTERSWEEDV